MQYYKAFELNIASTVLLPELLPGNSFALIDCHILIGTVAEEGLTEPIKTAVTYQVAHQKLWLSIPGIARFLITDGSKITIDPIGEIDEATLKVFILGPCLNTLLLQRGLYVLNGDVIHIKNYAYAIIGAQGVGKSVLATAFSEQYTILSSNACVINASGDALSGFPFIQLWTDSIKLLSLEKPTLRIRPLIEKWNISLENKFQPQSLPLKAICVLETHLQENISFKAIRGIEKFNNLKRHAYHPAFISHLVNLQQHQFQGMQLAKNTHMMQLIRPEKSSPDTLKNLIIEELNAQGLLA